MKAKAEWNEAAFEVDERKKHEEHKAKSSHKTPPYAKSHKKHHAPAPKVEDADVLTHKSEQYNH